MATGKADDTDTGDKTAALHLEAGKTGSAYLEEWMSHLPTHLLDVPLHQLSIPGSHNSGTYQLNKEWGIGPDADQMVKNLSSFPMARDIIHAWGKCQNLSIHQQLKAGVRYLDIRVAYHEPTEELHIVHSLFGPKIYSCMEEVKSFLDEHEKEVVLLDFNHFYAMELEHHLQLLTYLMYVFDSMLCPFSSLSSVTLNSLREKGTRVIVFYGHGSVLDFPDFWPGSTIHQAWSDTMDVDSCLSYQENAAKKRSSDQFHVCQAVLIPNATSIIQKLSSSLQAECCHINKRLPQWMNGDALKGCQGMVYTVDFVEQSDFVQSVVCLNK